MTRLPARVTVLVVQPDERAHAPVRETLARIERPRCEVHWVTSASTALAALDEHPHDAFLVDCSVGGLELAKKILAHTPHAPVILLDDAPDPETDVAAAEAGVAEYVTNLGLPEHPLRYPLTHQYAPAPP